jgi:hypothetical protein
LSKDHPFLPGDLVILEPRKMSIDQVHWWPWPCQAEERLSCPMLGIVLGKDVPPPDGSYFRSLNKKGRNHVPILLTNLRFGWIHAECYLRHA